MNYVDAVPKNDDVVESNGACFTYSTFFRPALTILAGVKIFVDPKAVMYLLGCRMDFVVSFDWFHSIVLPCKIYQAVRLIACVEQEDAVKAEFVFENPNAKGSCGCGESFNV